MRFLLWLCLFGFSSWVSAQDSPKRIAVVLTNHSQLGNTGRSTGFYLSEAAHPYAIFKAAGYSVDLISPRGGACPVDGQKGEDPDSRRFLEVAPYQQTLAASQVRPEPYAAILFAGGHGTMWDFPDNPDLQRLTAQIYDQGGVVAAVCHGPAGLVNVKLTSGNYLVAGKEVNSFTNEEEAAVGLTEVMPFALESRLIERGGHFQKAPNFQPLVVVSERLVTGQNPASATGVAQAVLDLLNQPKR